jgi:hypothetical protein
MVRGCWSGISIGSLPVDVPRSPRGNRRRLRADPAGAGIFCGARYPSLFWIVRAGEARPHAAPSHPWVDHVVICRHLAVVASGRASASRRLPRRFCYAWPDREPRSFCVQPHCCGVLHEPAPMGAILGSGHAERCPLEHGHREAHRCRRYLPGGIFDLRTIQQGHAGRGFALPRLFSRS